MREVGRAWLSWFRVSFKISSSSPFPQSLSHPFPFPPSHPLVLPPPPNRTARYPHSISTRRQRSPNSSSVGLIPLETVVTERRGLKGDLGDLGGDEDGSCWGKGGDGGARRRKGSLTEGGDSDRGTSSCLGREGGRRGGGGRRRKRRWRGRLLGEGDGES